MIDEILINAGLRRTRIALIADGRLCEFLSGRNDDEPRAGDIYFARIQRTAPEIAGAFVALGNGRSGLLRDRDGGSGLNEGAGLIVQVRREATDGKDVRVTARPRLPGRLLVFTPQGRDASVSSRIADADERQRLLDQARALSGDDGAFVARTAAATAETRDLDAEAGALRAAWADIADAGKAAGSSHRLHQDNIVAAALRDHLTPAVNAIVADGSDGAARARDFCQRYAPFALSRIDACGPGARAFDRHDTHAQIAAALDVRVDLPSGGWITFEPTQALTAIDVNTGASGAGDRAGEVWRRTNLEAAAEIARQIRLRDIAGNIVVDFIRMQSAGHGGEVLKALRAAVARDRVDVRVAGFSEFGLVEMTRQRDRTPLLQRLTSACTACAGSGRRPTTAEIADDLIDRAVSEARHSRGGTVSATAAPMVVDELGGPDGHVVQALFDRFGCRLQLTADPARRLEDFEVQAR